MNENDMAEEAGRGILAAEEAARRRAEKQARLEANPTRRAAIAAYHRVMKLLLGDEADTACRVTAPRMGARTEIRGGMARTVFASGEATPWSSLADEMAKAEAPTVESLIWRSWHDRGKRRG